jgi:hypothetical protein
MDYGRETPKNPSASIAHSPPPDFLEDGELSETTMQYKDSERLLDWPDRGSAHSSKSGSIAFTKFGNLNAWTTTTVSQRVIWRATNHSVGVHSRCFS